MSLKQNISIWKGIGIAVGMVIGSGLLGLPGMVMDLGGVRVSLLGWILIVISMLPMLYIFIRLGMWYPKSEGLSKYAEISLGKWGEFGVVAVLSGTFVIGIPALAMIGGAYACSLFDISESYTPWFAMLFLSITTIVNIFGIKLASWINNVSLLFIFLLVGILAFMYPEYLTKGISEFAHIEYASIDYKVLWSVMAVLFWAFLGWENLSFGLEEFKNPQKSIPIVYWTSFAIVSFLYIVLALTSAGAYLSGINVSGMNGIGDILTGNPSLKILLLVFMVFIILANANSWVFGASRLIYSAGKNGILFPFLGKLDKSNAPKNSLLFLGLFYIVFIAVIAIFDLKVSSIILLVSQNFLVLYAVSLLAYFKVSKTIMDYFIGLLGSATLLFMLSGFSWAMLYPIGLLLIGYRVYYKKHKENKDENN